ncbi:uncharacterized protein LOC112344065 [Selaginella moellendorffii]|uniref:uncharacterized protein LOC112344065 n=1 Tax=Selaginella moellendorffii TaxID=88036 RepID=UPI000D1CEAA7|nr:uncharacterized protein LOC112344065 [Selaginella moellendorffii]|eukprot:XP_024523954.1 uncharacterized protein LOC112344065 [Selaginella moellendorffii]
MTGLETVVNQTRRRRGRARRWRCPRRRAGGLEAASSSSQSPRPSPPSQLHGTGPDEANNSSLAHRVGVRREAPDYPGHAAREDDRAGGARLHDASGVLERQEVAPEVDVHGALQLGHVRLIQRPQRAQDAGVAEDNVYVSGNGVGHVQGGGHVRLRGDVAVDVASSGRGGEVPLELPREVAAELVLDVGYDDLSAVRDEVADGGVADTVCSTGDDCHFAE